MSDQGLSIFDEPDGESADEQPTQVMKAQATDGGQEGSSTPAPPKKKPAQPAAEAEAATKPATKPAQPAAPAPAAATGGRPLPRPAPGR